MKKRTWGIRCKLSELERVLVGVGQTERAITPSSEARHLSWLFRFRPRVRLGRKKILDLFMRWNLCANQLPTIDQRRICANQLPTIDQHMITYAFQISCMIIICLIKIRMYCDFHVAALFASKNRFIDHHDDRLSSNLLTWSIICD